MSSSYPSHNDMPRPLCLHCGMVLPRNLYCANCGYYSGSTQMNISAQKTQPSPAFHAPGQGSRSQSTQRPDHQYNNQSQNVSPLHPLPRPGAYAQGTSSVTPFLGIGPNMPAQSSPRPGPYTQGSSATPFLGIDPGIPDKPLRYPDSHIQGASGATPFLGIDPNISLHPLAHPDIYEQETAPSFPGIAAQPDVSRIESRRSSASATEYFSSYTAQPTLIVPVGLQKERERPPQDSKQVSRHKNRNKKFLFGIILALIILVGGGLASYLFLSSPATQKRAPTTASASRPQKPLTFVDTFKNNRNRWDLQSEAGKYSVAIANGYLTLEDDNNSLLPEFLPENRVFTNFKVTVDATLSKGDAKNGYGLYIRCASNQSGIPTTYYRFELYGDGTYAIFKGMLDVHGKISPGPLKLVSYTASSAIRKQGGSNHIEIDAQSTTMTIRVNGQVLKTFAEPSYAKGMIALFISNIQNVPPGARATFSKLTVYPS